MNFSFLSLSLLPEEEKKTRAKLGSDGYGT